MLSKSNTLKSLLIYIISNPITLTRSKSFRSRFIAVFAFIFVFVFSAFAQVIVQPGAPGKSTTVLPSDTTAKLPPVTNADVEFMQGMIHHHAQAVEMVALMEARTTNDELLRFGARISQTQTEEIKFMKRWLIMRGQKTSMQMKKRQGMGTMDGSDHDHSQMMMMPGMLTPKQMKDLANAKSSEFDKLFLTGMIQHHEGALVMVDELFKSQGAGQDVEMFTFATDVDGTQRAEIRLMKNMLGEKPKKL